MTFQNDLQWRTSAEGRMPARYGHHQKEAARLVKGPESWSECEYGREQAT
jgi:hypothetical protein